MNEAFKKQMLSSHEYYKPKRWQGKPWSFKIKYFYANFPEFALATLTFGIICPAMCAYRYFTYNGSRTEALKKYRSHYIVVRDDDPNIENIIKEKELGREHFPQF